MKQSPEHFSWSALSAAVTTGAACAYCGARDDLVAHHKRPRRYGGLDRLANLEPVCRGCHPRVEQEAIARAEQTWERPEWPRLSRRSQSPPRLLRPW